MANARMELSTVSVTGVCDQCKWAPVEIHVSIFVDEHTIKKGACGRCLPKFVLLSEYDGFEIELRPLRPSDKDFLNQRRIANAQHAHYD